MERDSAAAARRTVESTFDDFDGVALRELDHVDHTDFEHVFAFVAESTAGGGRTGISGRHGVDSGPVRWIEIVPNPVERTPVERTTVEVVGLEAEGEPGSAGSRVDDATLTGTVHCWHG